MKEITDPTLIQELEAKPVTDPALLQELEGGPVISAGPPPGAWDQIKGFFKDPLKEGAKAAQAMVDSELLGVSPSVAYNWHDASNRYFDLAPEQKEKRQKYLSSFQRFNGGEQEDGWISSLAKSAKGVPISMQIAAGGLMQMIEEGNVSILPTTGATDLLVSLVSGRREEEKVRSLGREIAAAGRKKQQENAPLVEPGSLKESVNSATSSVLNNAVTLLPSLATGNPAISLALMGAQATGEGYSAQREGGSSPAVATLASLGYGASEVLTEFIPLGKYLQPGKTFVKRLVEAEFTELPTETVNTIVSTVIDKTTISPDITLKDAIDRIEETIQTTALTTVGLSGLSHGAHKVLANKLPPELKGTFVEAKDKALRAGDSPQAALVAGVAAVKEAPGGQEVIDKFAETMRPVPPTPEVAPGVSIIGVDEDVESTPYRYTVADTISGETFTVPVGTDQATITARVEAARVPVDQQVDQIVQAAPEAEDAAIDAALGEEEFAGKLETFRDQVAQIVPLEQADAAATLLEARAAAVGMTADEYIDYHNLDVEVGRRFVKLGPGEMVNGITREQAGTMLANGDEAVLKHIEDGIKKHGVLPIQDAVRNQTVTEIASAPKGEARASVKERIGKLEPRIDDIFKRYEGSAAEGSFQDTKASITFEDNRTIIRAFEQADISSVVHELGHLFRRDLGGQDLKIAEDWAGVKEGKWTVPAEEKFARGFERYLAEGKAPTATLTKVFQQFKTWLTNIYQAIKGSSIDIEIPPKMKAVYDRMLTEEQEAGTLFQRPEKPKTTIRRTTGQTDMSGMVTERTALKAAFKKAAAAARAAMKEGKIQEAEKQKVIMKDMLAKEKTRSAARVAKIMTDKDKANRRRSKVRTIRDYFGLSDTDLRALSLKDPRNMTDYEFKRFADDIYLRAMELVENREARVELINTIQTKRLQKVDNYRRALDLPLISKMTTEQLKQFDEALQEFHEGDVFLTQRELETVDRTDLEGIRTWREAREALAIEANKVLAEQGKPEVTAGDLEKIKVTQADSYIGWDTALAGKNPFYAVMVQGLVKHELAAEMAYHNIESRVYELAKAAEASRPRTLIEKAVPQHKRILDYLEASEETKQQAATNLTNEELAYAAYIQEYFGQYLEYLIETKALQKGKENYFVHMRRTFTESVKEEGIVKAVKDMFKNYEQEEANFNILDDDTGNILPLEKFFRFSLHRSGEVEPSANVTKAFLTYAKMAEKKRAFDAIIPKMDIYARSLTPQQYTPRGLEVDASLKKFVNKWINNKKGRHISYDSVIKQGGPIDMAIHGLRVFTTLLYIGFSPAIRVATFIGEQATTLEGLGLEAMATGIKRMNTDQGKKILEKYKAFTGRGAWEEFATPGKELPERLSAGLFGLFHTATVTANKEFLMGSLTEEEFSSGTIDPDRLAAIRIELGRWRAVPGSSGLVGSTSVGKAFTQFKSWAVPILHTSVTDSAKIIGDLKNKSVGEALTSKEAQEMIRFVGINAAVIITGAMLGSEDDEEDESFIGQLKKRAYKEALTLLQGLNPTMWVASPVILAWMVRFVGSLSELVTLEEYKNKPGLKGVEGVKKALIPRQFIPEPKEE